MSNPKAGWVPKFLGIFSRQLICIWDTTQESMVIIDLDFWGRILMQLIQPRLLLFINKHNAVKNFWALFLSPHLGILNRDVHNSKWCSATSRQEYSMIRFDLPEFGSIFEFLASTVTSSGNSLSHDSLVNLTFFFARSKPCFIILLKRHNKVVKIHESLRDHINFKTMWQPFYQLMLPYFPG